MSMGESEAVTFLCDSAFSRLLFGGRIGNAANAQLGLAAGIAAATEGGLDVSDCNYSWMSQLRSRSFRRVALICFCSAWEKRGSGTHSTDLAIHLRAVPEKVV